MRSTSPAYPPEPNGYSTSHRKGHLHRLWPRRRVRRKTTCAFDDTNPEKEEQEYVDSIKADVRWLDSTGSGSATHPDYFGQLYEWA